LTIPFLLFFFCMSNDRDTREFWSSGVLARAIFKHSTSVNA
jgi:hypothetical protein